MPPEIKQWAEWCGHCSQVERVREEFVYSKDKKRRFRVVRCLWCHRAIDMREETGSKEEADAP